MRSYRVSVAKDYLSFSSAHFITFRGHKCESLHGHNYRVTCEIEGRLTEHGLVLDFKLVKPVVRELCDWLDEHWLVPAEHPVLRMPIGQAWIAAPTATAARIGER